MFESCFDPYFPSPFQQGWNSGVPFWVFESAPWDISAAASVISETTGREMEIFTEPASQPGYDGEKLSILGEFTFEFKNAKQKLCRVRNLRASKSGAH